VFPHGTPQLSARELKARVREKEEQVRRMSQLLLAKNKGQSQSQSQSNVVGNAVGTSSSSPASTQGLGTGKVAPRRGSAVSHSPQAPAPPTPPPASAYEKPKYVPYPARVIDKTALEKRGIGRTATDAAAASALMLRRAGSDNGFGNDYDNDNDGVEEYQVARTALVCILTPY